MFFSTRRWSSTSRARNVDCHENASMVKREISLMNFLFYRNFISRIEKKKKFSV
jgi:hypothetical protein